MHKYELLRLRAEQFREVLEEYAKDDSDVADFLQRWMPWYERVQRREIRLPCYDYKLSIYFNNPDLSPLAEHYSSSFESPLKRSQVNFSEAIRDWLSDPNYLVRLRAAGEEPDLIPDEPPPPEEEAPIPEENHQSKPTGFIKLMKRWFDHE